VKFTKKIKSSSVFMRPQANDAFKTEVEDISASLAEPSRVEEA
jgi:hypothetical protein